MVEDPGAHVETEDHGWDLSIPNHPPRADSPAYVASRKALHAIVAGMDLRLYGKTDETIQDHHGGGLPIRSTSGWWLVRNLVGIEWSAQWGADPAKVDVLRQTAQRLYAGFPDSVPALQDLVGSTYDVRTVLDTPITDADGVALWTDSIFNASVPLPQPAHTGVLPGAAGAHHYPAPVQEIPYFARDDLQVFVTHRGVSAAVVPVAPRWSGDGRAEVLWAQPGTPLHRVQQAKHARGERHIIPSSSPLAKKAFARQRGQTTL